VKRSLVACSLLFVAGCTPGSFATSGSDGAAGIAHVVTIDADLSKNGGGPTPAGFAAGFAPLAASVAVGDGVRFVNGDGFAHTASAIAGTTFPSAYPFDASALTARGAALSSGFTSGSIAVGATSQTFVADRAGTYLYGCFYHYGSPMRAEIVVQ